VTWDGRLSACCFDHDGRFNMGDLKKTAFMDAWHSPKFRELRAAHLHREVGRTVCGQCVSYEVEGGSSRDREEI
jgi:radical SAM protein with 4Fe4S-binding SPASM domain